MEHDMELVAIDTEQGRIEVELNMKAAPITCANFLHYVNSGMYTGGRFHRTVTPENQPNDTIRIEVLQGGPNLERKAEIGAPIALERTSETGLAHKDGTISMARFAPDSAVADFFICIGDQPELDFGGQRNPDGQGFAAFGQVRGGMDVVRAIQHMTHERQQLTPPVTIMRAYRIDIDDPV